MGKRRLRIENLAKERHAAKDLRAETALRPLRAGPAGNDAEAGFRLTNLHMRFRNPEIGTGRKF